MLYFNVYFYLFFIFACFLLFQLVNFLYTKPDRGLELSVWLRAILMCHTAYLTTVCYVQVVEDHLGDRILSLLPSLAFCPHRPFPFLTPHILCTLFLPLLSPPVFLHPPLPLPSSPPSLPSSSPRPPSPFTDPSGDGQSQWSVPVA